MRWIACVDRCLAHRFQRVGADAGPFAQAVQQNTRALLDSMGQAGAAAGGGVEYDGRRDGSAARKRAWPRPREQFDGGRAAGLGIERCRLTPKSYPQWKARRSSNRKLVETMASPGRGGARHRPGAAGRAGARGEGVAAQAAVLGRLQEGETNLVHLQAVLHQNLAALANASSFDQAVHSLTARRPPSHLPDGRTVRAVTPPTPRLGKAA